MARLSVLVPVYNEADNLIPLRNSLTIALAQLGHDWEVVLANDDSADGSTGILDQIAAADPRFKVVHLRRNFGQTAALMAALDHSVGDIVVTIDADLQNDPSDIGRLLAKLDEGYDVVSGWRQERGDDKWRAVALPACEQVYFLDVRGPATRLWLYAQGLSPLDHRESTPLRRDASLHSHLCQLGGRQNHRTSCASSSTVSR